MYISCSCSFTNNSSFKSSNKIIYVCFVAASDPDEGAPRPVIVPPDIETLLAACVDIVPSPNDVLAVDPVSATHVEPLPTIKLQSVVEFPITVKFAFDAPFASNCVCMFELHHYRCPNSVLEIVPS